MSADDKYYAVIDQKLNNRGELNKINLNIGENDHRVTTKLINHYDKNFDDLYVKTKHIESAITSRDQLININNDEYERKTDIVFILKNLLFLMIFVFAIFILKYLHIIHHQTARNIYIVSFILYIVITYYKIAYNKFTLGESRANQFAYDSTSSIFKNAAKILLPNFMTRDRCPTGCKQKHPHPGKCPENMPGCDNTDIVRIKEMSTDSTLNNWKKGDILYKDCEVISPSELSQSDLREFKARGIDLNKRLMKCPLRPPYTNPDTNEVVNYIIMNEPEPWYSSVKNSTIYDCEWEGVGEPLGDQGVNFKSSIPCHHYPGYK